MSLSETFGSKRTISVSQESKDKMQRLASLGIFKEKRDIWRLGVAWAISKDEKKKPKDSTTFQNINSLDSDGIITAIMQALYEDKTSDERYNLLLEYAEWGIYELDRLDKISSLDFLDFLEE